jgi:hypothetical protein
MAIMSPALDRERQRARLRPSVAKRAPLPSTTPTSVICWKKFCERTMDFDFGEDFIDHLGAGDPYGRAGMGSLFQRPQALTHPPSPSEHTERTLILRHIRASTGSKISFSYLADYAQSVGLDGTKLAQIITDLIHVALTDEGHQSGFSFTALPWTQAAVRP